MNAHSPITSFRVSWKGAEVHVTVVCIKKGTVTLLGERMKLVIEAERDIAQLVLDWWQLLGHGAETQAVAVSEKYTIVHLRRTDQWTAIEGSVHVAHARMTHMRIAVRCRNGADPGEALRFTAARLTRTYPLVFRETWRHLLHADRDGQRRLAKELVSYIGEASSTTSFASSIAPSLEILTSAAGAKNVHDALEWAILLLSFESA